MADADDARRQAAERLLSKLRTFVVHLDEDERTLLATLLAPGVADAWEEPFAEREADDVSGHGLAEPDLVPWHPARLPEHLAAAVRAHRLRIDL